MKILTVTTLYPNAVQFNHGLFVEQRLLQLVRTGHLEARVVAPVPWFPFRSPAAGRYSEYARVPRVETRNGLTVSHPRYFVIPKIGMTSAPFLLERAIRTEIGRNQLAKKSCDLIDAHYFYPDGVAAALAARQVNKPLVITARGSDINVLAQYAAPRKMIKWAAKRAAAIIAVSEALSDELIKIGVPSERIFVLPNGVNKSLFHEMPDRSELREQLRASGQVLLLVGHLKEGKGHRLAIRGLKRLPGAMLLIAGDGPLRTKLEEFARQQSVADRVRFVGAVEQSDLIRYYNAADITILPSEREGMPNVLLESISCGTPVIASPVGGVPEIITDETVGLIMRDISEDAFVTAVQLLAKNYPNRSDTLGHRARFDWQPVIGKQIDLYREVVSARPGIGDQYQ